jgi:hypothetical protein
VTGRLALQERRLRPVGRVAQVDRRGQVLQTGSASNDGPCGNLGVHWSSRIVEIQLARLRWLLADRPITIEPSEAAREAIVDAGYDPLLGARPLERALQRLGQDPLATKLLRGEFEAGDYVVVPEGPEGAVPFKEGARPAEAPAVVHRAGQAQPDPGPSRASQPATGLTLQYSVGRSPGPRLMAMESPTSSPYPSRTARGRQPRPSQSSPAAPTQRSGMAGSTRRGP